MNTELLNDWIEDCIEHMQERIDDAMANNYPDVKLRSEGYIQALIHCQQFILQDSKN